MTIEEMACIIFNQACLEGIEEIHFDIPWNRLPGSTQDMYLRIAQAVASKIPHFEGAE